MPDLTMPDLTMPDLTFRVLSIGFVGGAIACSSPSITSPQMDSPRTLESSAPLPATPPSHHSSYPVTQETNTLDESNMMSQTSSNSHPTVRNITLIAREAAIPAIGEPDTPDRPIGFASVFLSIENPANAEQTLILESVEVVSVDTREVLFSQMESQPITLMPLENTQLAVQLRNQQGYPGTHRVMAIATYRVTIHPDTDDETPIKYSVDSPVVDVERSP